MSAWDPDVKITVACAVVSATVALLQLVAAGIALRAAWKIAADQKDEADRLRREAHADFIAAVSALAEEALFEADKADTALRAGAGPNGILYNFSQRLADLHEALQPIRGAAPPDARLMLAVGRLSRVLIFGDSAGVDAQTALLQVGQHRGSIGLALQDIHEFGGPSQVYGVKKRTFSRSAMSQTRAEPTSTLLTNSIFAILMRTPPLTTRPCRSCPILQRKASRQERPP
jgi:hypothetical protein